VVGYDGVKHIKNDDWDAMLQQSIEMKGFVDEKHCLEIENKIHQKEITSTVGFNHRVFDSLSDTLLGMIKSEKIKGFRFVGGCDGVNKSRNLFT
jgi:hydroxylamine reductase (hybrid-cluster protein)